MELNNLEKFPINGSPREIPDYLECFDAWCISKNVRDDKIPAYFITAIGLDAYSLVKTLSFPDNPLSLSYDKLRKLLIHHFHVTTFETRERAQFNKLVRSPNQKIRDFILQLQIQASRCNFGNQLHTQLRDRLIAGINIPKLEKELIQIPSCTFQTAKDLCITYEDVNDEYSAPNTSVSDIMLSKVDNTSVHVIECSERAKTLNRVFLMERFIHEALAVVRVLSVINRGKLDTSNLFAEVRILMLLSILIVLPICLVKWSQCVFQLFKILNLIQCKPSLQVQQLKRQLYHVSSKMR
uniref:Retrotransposon gag domain-containing protein n=1 Tax=Trichobilharzia regenti TaxID=157069 RepID=A0AA85KM83_TRIRE|nr:unnamed protein product [Trichobilharzia regenti]